MARLKYIINGWHSLKYKPHLFFMIDFLIKQQRNFFIERILVKSVVDVNE